MDLLENYRSEIDNIDKEMTLLFENRMNLSKKYLIIRKIIICKFIKVREKN